MSKSKIQLGRFGEQLAGKYLKSKGYKILAKNFYTRNGEIDLVCQKNNVITFVEVKTRTNRNFGWPEEAVTEQKLEKIALAAEKYLQDHKIKFEWQIDIISILIDKKIRLAKLGHLKNIVIS